MLALNAAVLSLALSMSAPAMECRDDDFHGCLDRLATEVFAANDWRYAMLDDDEELVGVIVERNGTLFSSAMRVVDAKRPWRLTFEVQGRLVALLHTHPESSQPDGFSGRDREDVGVFKGKGSLIASYVRLASGRVRKLTRDLAHASAGHWVPGLPVCRDDAPCLPSLQNLRRQFALLIP